MGKKDSSKTRVQPFFEKVFDAKNTDWIAALLNMFDTAQAKALSENIGTLKDDNVGNGFERKLAPPERFLEWLILNPAKMQWPGNGHTEFGIDTQKKRESLIKNNDEEIQREALQELKSFGSQNSRNKWWAFEGYTAVDFLIETDKIVLAVEGKRTETGPAENVFWYSGRNQIVRNLEALQQFAQGRLFAVVLIDEKGTYQLSNKDIKDSLPHLSKEEQMELASHFLGSAAWKEVCLKNGVDYNSLPDEV